MEDSKLALAEWLGCEPDELQEQGSYGAADYYEYEGKEYAVYSDWNDVELKAVEQAEDYIEQQGLEGFSDSFKERIIDEGLVDTDWFEEAMHESNEFYASDIKEEGSDEYANRLVEECIDRGVISESELDENKDYIGNIDDLVYEYAKYLDSNESAIEWYRLNFGDEQLRQVVEENDLLDKKRVAERMVDLDGAEQYLSQNGSYVSNSYNGVDYYIFCTYE